MTVKVNDQIDGLRPWIGDDDSDNYRWTDTVLREKKFPAGVKEFNINFEQEYEILGSGTDAYFSPEPDDMDAALIVICAAIATLRGQGAKAAMDSVAVSNPAGKTDLTKVPQNIRSYVSDLKTLIRREKLRRGRQATEKNISVRELHSRDTSQIPEGIPIVTIKRSK